MLLILTDIYAHVRTYMCACVCLSKSIIVCTTTRRMFVTYNERGNAWSCVKSCADPFVPRDMHALNRPGIKGTDSRRSGRVSGLVTLVMRLCLQCGNTTRQEMLRALARHRRERTGGTVSRSWTEFRFTPDDEYCNNPGFIMRPTEGEGEGELCFADSLRSLVTGSVSVLQTWNLNLRFHALHVLVIYWYGRQSNSRTIDKPLTLSLDLADSRRTWYNNSEFNREEISRQRAYLRKYIETIGTNWIALR